VTSSHCRLGWSSPASALRALPAPSGSARRRLPLPPPPPPPAAETPPHTHPPHPTAPWPATEPDRRRRAMPRPPERARGCPGRRALTSGSGVVEKGTRPGGSGGAEQGRWETRGASATPTSPGASEQRPLCSRLVPLPGRLESRGCGIVTRGGDRSGQVTGLRPELGSGEAPHGVQGSRGSLGRLGGVVPLPVHLLSRVPATGAPS
jgi:hypothetical protein